VEGVVVVGCAEDGRGCGFGWLFRSGEGYGVVWIGRSSTTGWGWVVMIDVGPIL